MGPEFLRVLEEPLVVLELPGSILVSSCSPKRLSSIFAFFGCQVYSLSPFPQTKKGKSPATHRELSVVMPNGQSILVKCEVKTRGGDVFDMIVAHSNLVEHFYFGLAYIDGKIIVAIGLL